MEEVRAHPGEITGLITGPLTNFALALRREPELPRLLKGLVIMGGSFYYQGNTTPTAEWNTSVDPHAAKEVYAAYRGLPEDKLPVVCALETTERIEMRPEHLRRLGEAAGAPEPELVLPEQPEGLRSRSSSPLVGVPVGRDPVLHGVPPALRPGLCGAHARRLRRLRRRRDARRSAPGWPRWTSKRNRRCWSAPRWPTSAACGGCRPTPGSSPTTTPRQCFDELISSVGALGAPGRRSAPANAARRERAPACSTAGPPDR